VLDQRVVGSIVLSEQHLTKDELLAKAREFYVNAAVGQEQGAIE